MERTTHNDQTIISYLLNELSKDDQERFEDGYLEDEDLFEQVRALEEELIEDYVKGELSTRERQLFEGHYLASAERRARVAAARRLVQVCSSQSALRAVTVEPRDHSFLRARLFSFRQPLALGFGAAAALLLLLGAGLVLELSHLRGQMTAADEERAALARRNAEIERQLADRNAELALERQNKLDLQKKIGEISSRSGQPVRVPAPVTQPEDDLVASLELAPQSRDLNKPDRAVISSGTKFVGLRVILERQERPLTYRAAVKTLEGTREIWSEDGLKLRQTRAVQYLVLRVPAEYFRAVESQAFSLTISAPSARGKDYDEIERYYFRVAMK